MDTVRTQTAAGTDLRRKVVLAASAAILLMILFPPKYGGQRMLGQSNVHSAGYQFILSDPSGSEDAVAMGMPAEMKSELFVGGVEYGKLLIQIAVVAGLAFAATRFLDKQHA